MGDFSAEKVFLFVLYAVPGAVAIRVYSLWCPVPQKDWKESITDALIYSSVIAAFWLLVAQETVLAFVFGLMQHDVPPNKLQAVQTVIDHRFNLILYILFSPTLLSSVWYQLRLRVCHRLMGFDHPTRTAWDWVFSRRVPVYVLFHLKTKTQDNQQVIRAGYFNGESYVTSYPYEPEIYVERVHAMRPDGRVGMPIPDTAGMLVKLSECERLEFLTDPSPLPQTIWQRSRRRTIGCVSFVRDRSGRAYGFGRNRVEWSMGWLTTTLSSVCTGPLRGNTKA